MKERLKIEKHYTLYKWIMLGCIALMIPITCAVINFFINKNLVERKIDQVNDFMLKNIQYNIDSKLNNILELSKYYLLNQDFALYALNTQNEKQFQARVRSGHQSMNLSAAASPGMEIMMYIREKDYIIGSETANQIEYIYGSLVTQGKLSLSLEDWKEQLTQQDRSGFLISDTMGYLNCGAENLVYATPILYSNAKEAGYLIVTMPAEFINILMSREMEGGEMGAGSSEISNNTILILDQNDVIIGEYGVELDLKGVRLELPSDREKLMFTINRNRYVGAYTDSDVTSWKYVVCTPERDLMEEVVFNRNINLLIVLIGAVIGAAAMILLQRRNYRPVKKLMDILPEREDDGDGRDEFMIVEKNLRRLYEENQSMQDSIESRKEYDRELGLLSTIKGRDNYFRKLSKKELLGGICQDCCFAFVTIRLDLEEGGTALERPIDYNLLGFLIDNVTTDILGNEYRYIKTIDNVLLVYLFIINKEEQKGWEEKCREKFTWLNEFFQKRLEADLSITLGRFFDSFEQVVSAYAEIEEANDQRYYTQPFGVVRADETGNIDFSSAGRLVYYGKRFEVVAVKANSGEARALCNELFSELESSGKPYHIMMYYVLSTVNSVLMASRNLTRDESVREEALEEALTKLRTAESFSTLKEEYFHFLQLICRAVDEDSRDSRRLSENIKGYVKAHYADCNMNISAIAEEIGITPRYMSKIFKEQTGIGLLGYINDVRIEHAKVLLKTTGKTVDEISEETGFANSRTFRRNFLKAVGVTAMNYKNM